MDEVSSHKHFLIEKFPENCFKKYSFSKNKYCRCGSKFFETPPQAVYFCVLLTAFWTSCSLRAVKLPQTSDLELKSQLCQTTTTAVNGPNIITSRSTTLNRFNLKLKAIRWQCFTEMPTDVAIYVIRISRLKQCRKKVCYKWDLLSRSGFRNCFV